ncbi:uncharacterized protein TNCV_2740341 [Trichonephila clavipes]|nr:uncharacterized protein TNCV_2740341 [Trichonephila clavipes]
MTPLEKIPTVRDLVILAATEPDPHVRSSHVDSNPEDGMDICKCIALLRHGGTLNSRRAASSFVWLVEGEEEREATGHPQGFLPLNWGRTEKNRTVTCMVLKAKANDMRKNSSP